MKTFPALYIDPQGVIRYTVPFEDQEQAKKLLFEKFCIFPAEYKDGVEYIRPLPSGWGVKVREVLDSVSSGASPFGSVSNYKKVAVLIPPPTSEQKPKDPEVEEWLKTVTDEQWQFATKLRDDLKGNMGTRGKMLIAKALESYASQFKREGVEGQAVDIDEFLQSYYGAPKPTGQMQCEYDNLFDLLLAFQKRFKGVEGQKEARISELEAENEKNIKWANDAETRAVAAEERIVELEAENKRLRELIQEAEAWLELIQEAEAWLSFNMRPDAAQITHFRKLLQKALNPQPPKEQ